MKITINKEEFWEKLSLSSHFTSTRISSLTILQGVLIVGDKEKINFYSTNLSSFFHTSIKKTGCEKLKINIEPKKIIEFLSLLTPGNLNLEIKEKQFLITAGKTKGTFPLLATEDFPLPPGVKEKEKKIQIKEFIKDMSLVLFTTSTDETRPVLTGIKFVTQDEDLLMVATDGFRLSMVKTKKEIDIPSMIVPADFLTEIAHQVGDKEVLFTYSQTEKIIGFKIGDNEFFSRLIEGEYTQFKKVIPQEKKTTIKLDTDELIRNVKLISVFARDYSNIVVIETVDKGIQIKPKHDATTEDVAFQEATIEGESQRVAFNYKFLLDLLNRIKAGSIIIELLRPDAPVVFKLENNNNFLHIIMPVRIQE